jgi:hypothetical protein
MRYLHGFLFTVALAVSATGAAAQHADPAAQRPEPAAPQADPAAQTASSKLSTVLAALSQSVTQTTSTAQRAGGAQPLSLDSASKPVKDAMQGGWLRLNASQEVQVYILMTEVTDATVGQLTSAGATIEIRDAVRRRVQARVPVAQLQAVAQLGVVNAIRLPTYARRRTGAVTSEGDTILYADNVRSQLTLDGTGVRVGVVSDGLKGVFATGCTSCAGSTSGPITSGDLPSATGVRNASGVLTSSTGGILGQSFQANGDLEGLPPASPVCGDPGAGAEGTALLEIVHDLAPGAKLSFANGDTDLAFAQAVSFLAASNDVVLDDIGFYGEPYDGTSYVSSNTAAALNNPAYPVRAYFTSVGNDADEHYDGAYTDSGVDGTTISGIGSAGHLHLFQRTTDTTDVLGLGPRPYNVIQLPQNGEVAIFLTWDDAFGASSNNYDLYLVQQSTGRVVASSTDVQSGKQDPSEFIDYVNPGGQDYFRIVVQNVRDAARPANLNLFSFQPQCAVSGPTVLAPPAHDRHNFNTASRSVSAESDAGGSPVSVVAVGAICSASAGAASVFSSSAPDESCLDTSHATPEFFSSRGPTVDGRVKPDIAGIDGVSVTGAGGFSTPFFGTSAAAPHLGAIAALLLQGAPCLMNRAASTIDPATARGKVRNMLLGHAIGLGGPVPDNNVGAGRIDAFAAVNATLPRQQGTTNFTVDANTPFGAALSAGQLGFSDPDGCGLTTLNWTGACGTSPGSTMTCPAGTSSVSVSASNNGVAFSPATDMQITVTDFAIAVAPTAATIAAGGTAQYVVTVSPQGGAFKSAVTLTCANGNLPIGATCSFNPPTLTPGATPAQSILTITTTKSSLVAPGRWTPFGPMVRLAAARVLATPPIVGWTMFSTLIWFTLGRAIRRRSRSAFAVRFGTACLAGATCVAAVGVLAPVVLAQSGIAVFPDTLTFASQIVSTTTPPQVLYLTNIGVATLNVTSIVPAGDFSVVTDCGTTLAVGQSCGAAVSFTPTVTGARSGTLTITDDAAGSPHTVTLNGTGQAAPSTGTGTPAGTYSVAVSGIAGTMTHAASLTLAVQ